MHGLTLRHMTRSGVISQSQGNSLQADAEALVNTVNTVKTEPLGDVEVLLFPPYGAPDAASMPATETAPRTSPGRAALIGLLAGYSRHALAEPLLIEAQKLVYFLQLAGEPLRLEFQGHRYGPNADDLRHVLREVEGHCLSGFGDGATRAEQAEPSTLLPGAEDAAQPVREDQPETRERIERVLDVIAAVQAWSPRKGRLFTPEHIRIAVEALESRGWVPQLTGAR